MCQNFKNFMNPLHCKYYATLSGAKFFFFLFISETTVKDFRNDSFITWEFKNSFYNKMNDFKNEMQVRFRTRETDGLLFRVPSSNPNNFMQLEVRTSCFSKPILIALKVTSPLFFKKITPTISPIHTRFLPPPPLSLDALLC